MTSTTHPKNIHIYAIAIIFSFIGGVMSNGFLTMVTAQQDDNPDDNGERQNDKPAVQKLIRAETIELVAPDGTPLVRLGAREGDRSHSAFFEMGRRSPRNDEWEGIRMHYGWSDNPDDGMYHRLKEGAKVGFDMHTNYLGTHFRLQPEHMSLGHRMKSSGKEKPEFTHRWIQLQPRSLELGTNNNVQAYISTDWNGGSVLQLARGSTITGSDRRSVRLQVLGDKEESPRLEIGNADGKSVASFPGEE